MTTITKELLEEVLDVKIEQLIKVDVAIITNKNKIKKNGKDFFICIR